MTVKTAARRRGQHERAVLGRRARRSPHGESSRTLVAATVRAQHPRLTERPPPEAPSRSRRRSAGPASGQIVFAGYVEVEGDCLFEPTELAKLPLADGRSCRSATNSFSRPPNHVPSGT